MAKSKEKQLKDCVKNWRVDRTDEHITFSIEAADGIIYPWNVTIELARDGIYCVILQHQEIVVRHGTRDKYYPRSWAKQVALVFTEALYKARQIHNAHWPTEKKLPPK